MSYNNKYNNNQYNGPFKPNYGFQGPGYAPNRTTNPMREQLAKRSGATYTKMKNGPKEGLICVNAWRKTSIGLMTASAFPVDGVIHKGADKGHEFMRYAVKIIINGQVNTHWCLMRLDTKMIVLQDLSLVISPNGQGYTKSGKRVSGYFGSNFKRK
jgi:hypothetical protein